MATEGSLTRDLGRLGQRRSLGKGVWTRHTVGSIPTIFKQMREGIVAGGRGSEGGVEGGGQGSDGGGARDGGEGGP